MPYFTSSRERRLWIAVASVVVAIYGTLPLLGVLTEEGIPDAVLGVLFGAGFVGAIVATLANGLRASRSRELWVGIGVIAVYLTAFVRLGLGPLERGHLFEYGIVSLLIYEALRERARTRPIRFIGLIAVTAGAVLGSLDEVLQSLIPTRVFDLRDIGVNALAATLSVAATASLRWARRGAGERRREEKS